MMFVLDKSRLKCYFNESQFADMAELADAPDLGSGGNPRAGSSPVIRTQWREAEPGVLFQESVRRGGKLHAEIAKNKSVRA